MTNTLLTGREFNDLHPAVRQRALKLRDNYTVVNGKAYDLEGEYLGDQFQHDLTPKKSEAQVNAQQKFTSSKQVLGAHEEENGGFVFTFFKQSHTINERFPSLNHADIARLMNLGTYTAWTTGRLQYDNGRVIDAEGFEKLTGLSTKRARELFKRYVDEGILSQQEGAIYMNHTVFYRGNVSEVKSDIVDMQYTRMFKKTVRDLYEQFNGRTVGQLALVYSLMPFLNFNFNIVCYNPDESDKDLVRPISLEHVAELIGYESPAKLKTALNRVKIGDKVVFNFFESTKDRRQKHITVNPRVIYAGDGKHLDAIMVQFN
ncbi:hypothetical protein [Solibacillus sp. FSL K6-1126]|uniref:hypothetical protein n=1 Tax=Solibacillus sp. FSL K6-1126 TaxID=2921463 RepID=UPI0030F5702A